MNEYLLELKVKNNYLSEKMKAFGIKSQSELARFCEVTPQAAGLIMNMKEAPYNTRGEMRPYVAKVLDALFCSLEDLYPPEQLKRSLDKNIYTATVQAEELRAMLSSEISIAGVIEHAETVDALEKAIDSSMNERHAKVLRMRFFEEKTLKEVGQELGVTGARIREIEAKGLRLLRRANTDDKKKLHACMDAL
jgi:RNA polymerase sigma factor (sigma-70 family)